MDGLALIGLPGVVDQDCVFHGKGVCRRDGGAVGHNDRVRSGRVDDLCPAGFHRRILHRVASRDVAGFWATSAVHDFVQAVLIQDEEVQALIQCLLILGIPGHVDDDRFARIQRQQAQEVLSKLLWQVTGQLGRSDDHGLNGRGSRRGGLCRFGRSFRCCCSRWGRFFRSSRRGFGHFCRCIQVGHLVGIISDQAVLHVQVIAHRGGRVVVDHDREIANRLPDNGIQLATDSCGVTGRQVDSVHAGAIHDLIEAAFVKDVKAEALYVRRREIHHDFQGAIGVDRPQSQVVLCELGVQFPMDRV